MAEIQDLTDKTSQWTIDPAEAQKVRKDEANIVTPLLKDNPHALIVADLNKPFELNHFCNNCCRIIDALKLIDPVKGKPLPGFDPNVDWYDEPLAMVKSAARGCHLCSLMVGTNPACYERLAERQSPASKGWKGKMDGIRVTLTHTHGDKGLNLRDPICLINQPGGHSTTNVWWSPPDLEGNEVEAVEQHSEAAEVESEDTTEELEDGYEFRQPLHAFTGHRDALGLCGFWLQNCMRHSLCYKSLSQGTVEEWPTRLLDVSGKHEVDPIKLVSAAELGKASYFALSYCWGKVKSVTLTRRSLTEMMKEINVASLPRTIRDAIAVTRALGFPYLWIDALCIIQDSKEDWEKEATKMAAIYRNSVVTIAALWASGNDDGLFAYRNPLWFRTCKLLDTGYIVSNGSNYMTREYFHVGSEGTTAALQTRGWVAQEHYSAPRTLYFGRSGLLWECAEGEFHESDPTGVEGLSQSRPMAKLGLIGTAAKYSIAIFLDWYEEEKARLDSTDRQELIREFRDVWRVILERYTACQLTYQSDRIPAIIGLANMLSKTLKLTFCSGVWEDDILHDILWKTIKPCETAHPNRGFPTWSWASTTEAVQCLSSRFLKKEADFLEIMRPSEEKLIGTGSEEVGGSGWVLKLRAQLLEVELLPREDYRGPRINLLRPRARLKLVGDPRYRDVKPMRGGGYPPGHIAWWPDYEIPSNVEKAWCITVALIENKSEDQAGIAGIIVLPLDEEKKRWKRIGLIKDKEEYEESIKNPYLPRNNERIPTQEIFLV